jgi:predicted phosphoribosyltransferase
MSMRSARFPDRRAAGRELAAQLGGYRGRDDLLVLALPRGGVPVGFEVARALRVPLDVLVVRKLGCPGHEELAMGAIASGVRVVNPDLAHMLRVTPSAIDAVVSREQEELQRRERLYRGGRALPVVAGRTVILVDDGLATGSTMLAAIRSLRAQHPAEVIAAVPVSSVEAARAVGAEADRLVTLATPDAFDSVGQWYAAFPQTSDAEVRDLLDIARRPLADRRRPE